MNLKVVPLGTLTNVPYKHKNVVQTKRILLPSFKYQKYNLNYF